MGISLRMDGYFKETVLDRHSAPGTRNRYLEYESARLGLGTDTGNMNLHENQVP